MMHLDLAVEKFNAIAEELDDLGKVEMAPKKLGRRMTMVMAPDLSHKHEDKKEKDATAIPTEGEAQQSNT